MGPVSQNPDVALCLLLKGMSHVAIVPVTANTTEPLKITQGTAAPAERPAPIANASANT